jgi:IS30 family transposase
MPKGKHLTLSDRIAIETGIKENLSFKVIAEEIGKDPSTISKEVRAHIVVTEKSTYNPCLLRKQCPHISDLCNQCSYKQGHACNKCKDCYTHCPDYVEQKCERIKKPPYVCLGCSERHSCRLQRYIYSAKTAQAEYEKKLSESRQGIAISRAELKRLDKIISPLVRQGQSIHAICSDNIDRIMLDEKTIYNYIDAGLLSIRNIDLPRKVRYRVRKKKKPVRVDKRCHEGRTYDDYLLYLESNPDITTIEMDSVEGRQGGKVLLTIYFPNCEFMFAFLRDQNDARSVTDNFNRIDRIVGRKMFRTMFPVILTDRGSEFTDPLSIECDDEGNVRTKVFFCDPQRSDQKGGCEVAHEMIRRILPKGSSFDHLTQEDINLMMSHINSYTRKKLGNQSAYRLFSFFYGEKILKKLGIKEIPSSNINLTPKLLQK